AAPPAAAAPSGPMVPLQTAPAGLSVAAGARGGRVQNRTYALGLNMPQKPEDALTAGNKLGKGVAAGGAVDRKATPARRAPDQQVALQQGRELFALEDEARLKQAEQKAQVADGDALAERAEAEQMPQVAAEAYARIVDNPFQPVSKDAQSTFSI